MLVASANPQALDPAGLDPTADKREKDVLADLGDGLLIVLSDRLASGFGGLDLLDVGADV